MAIFQLKNSLKWPILWCFSTKLLLLLLLGYQKATKNIGFCKANLDLSENIFMDPRTLLNTPETPKRQKKSKNIDFFTEKLPKFVIFAKIIFFFFFESIFGAVEISTGPQKFFSDGGLIRSLKFFLNYVIWIKTRGYIRQRVTPPPKRAFLGGVDFLSCT